MKDGMRLGGHAALQYTSEGLIKLTIPKNRGGEDEPASMLGPVERIYGIALGLVAAELPAHELSVRVLIDMLRRDGLRATSRQVKTILRDIDRRHAGEDHRARQRARAHESQPVALWVMRHD
jgi:transposase-like protein